jgi:hypothetical protein
MNKKAYSKIWTFLIIVIAIGLLILISVNLLTGLGKSINKNTLILTINKIKSSIYEISMENAGVTSTVNINPPTGISMTCFIDYNKEPEPNLEGFEKEATNISQELEIKELERENVIFFYNKGFELYYIKGIFLNQRVHCIQPSVRTLKLTAKGKSVLIE